MGGNRPKVIPGDIQSSQMTEMTLCLMFPLRHQSFNGGKCFSFLIYAEFIKILVHCPFRIRISIGLINGEHTGQSLQLDIPSQKPNLIVTNSYLSLHFTDRREELWTGFTNAGLGRFQSLSIIEAAIFSPQGGVFIFYQGKNYKLDVNGIIRM